MSALPAWVIGYAPDVLTPTEVAVLQALANGYRLQEAAEHLHFSVWWVKDLAASARRKLGAKNLAHAVALAWRAGAIS